MKKIILCRTAWMKYYEGHANIDVPRSGAKWILKNKTGGEIYNFKQVHGKVRGCFPYINQTSIEKLGASRHDEILRGVTVVFCARHPVEGGIRVVGWYRNAIVFRNWQKNSLTPWGYHCQAKAKDAELIQENDRLFRLPDTFGRSSLYYIAQHKHQNKLLKDLIQYINKRGLVSEVYSNLKKRGPKSGRAYQPDITKRIMVEKKAVKTAIKHYQERYGSNCVQSVEKDNVGWDLEVQAGNKKLKIEVKGLSGSEIFVELTPNEYRIFNQRSPLYELFIVNDALKRKPVRRIFKYQSKGNMWVGDDKTSLKRTPVIGARLTEN